MTEEQMLTNYEKAQRLQSWADLFGFNIHMGRDGDCAKIEVDGQIIMSGDVDWAITAAAKAMGMEEGRLNGE